MLLLLVTNEHSTYLPTNNSFHFLLSLIHRFNIVYSHIYTGSSNKCLFKVFVISKFSSLVVMPPIIWNLLFQYQSTHPYVHLVSF